MKYNKNFEELIKKVESLSPEMLANHGILIHSPDGLFVCPFCGNGSGDDGTGLGFKDTGNTFASHCFKCGENFNIIHVLAKHFNLDSKSQFHQVIEEAARLFNLDSSRLSPPTTPKAKELKDYSAVINFARSNLRYLVENFGKDNAYRGLSFDTLRRFYIGFNPNFCFNKKYSKRVIIPTSNHHYLARAIDDSVPKAERKIHSGPKDIFNFKALTSASSDDVFFLVEGEFDAMSIIQAGFNAIAISGSAITSSSEYGISQLKQFKSLTVKPTIIVMLDADHKADSAADSCVETLKAIGFKVGKTFLPEVVDNQPVNDANDILQLNPVALKSILADLLNTHCSFAPSIQDQLDDFDLKHNVKNTSDHFDDCPADLSIPEGFTIKDGALFKVFKTKKGDEATEFVCGTPVFITKKLISYIGDGARLQLTFRRNKAWHFFDINIADIADPRALARVFGNHGLPLDSKGARWLSNFLVKMEHYNSIERELYYPQPGWVEGEFIYPGAKVIRGGFEYEEAFAAQGSEEKEVANLQELLVQSTMARVTLGASAAAPLVRILGIRNGILNLCPPSESGKTALAMTAMSLWGNPKKLFNSFSGTVRSLMELPSYYNDLPTWIDELESADEFVIKNLRTMIMDYCNGLVRARMTKDSELKAKVTFRGTQITTGERRLTEMAVGNNSGNGAFNRVLVMEKGACMDRAFAADMHKYFADEKKASFGHTGRKWTAWLSDENNQAEVKKYFLEMQMKIRRRAAMAGGYCGNMDDSTIKSLPAEVVGLSGGQIMTIALFLTGLRYFSLVAFGSDIAEAVDDFIDREDIRYFVTEYRKEQTVSTTERALPEILDDINKHAAEFSFVHPANKRLIAPEGKTSYGIKERSCYGLRTKDFKELVKKELGYPSPQEIINGLSKYGLLVEDGKDGYYEHKHRVCFVDEAGNYQSEWVYMLKENALELMEEAKARRVEKASAA